MRYNYRDIAEEIKGVCSQHPEVGQVVFNEYSIDTTGDICYPVIAITPNPHTIGPDITIYSFNLLFADRLTEARDNTLIAQSKGIDILAEIVNVMRNELDMDIQDDLSISVYSGQFADQVAGSVATVNFIVPSNIGMCDWFNIEPLCNKNA